MTILLQPLFKEAALRTSANIVRLGILAGAAVFANNIFKTQAMSTLELAKMDYHNIRDMMRSH